MRKTSVLITLSVFVFFGASCRQAEETPEEPAAYPVAIENIEGIKTVQNPDYPKDGRMRYALSEELTLGDESASDMGVLNRPQYLDVDAEGNIYVMDWGDVDIKVFSPEGRLIRTIGGKGQGPGEFDTPASFKISKDNTLFLLSGRQYRISALKTTGEYISGFTVDGYPPDIDVDSSNRVYYSELLPPEETLTEDSQKVEGQFALYRRNADGKNKVKLGEFKERIQVKRAVKTATGTSIMSGTSREAYTTCWFVDPQDRIHIGYNKDYQISVYDPDWNLIFRFGRAFTPIKHPLYKPEMGHPEYYPAFSERRTFFDDSGNLWLEQYTPEDVEEYVYDVFSPDGIYLKQVWLPETLYHVRGDKAYSILRTEEEFLVVKRFGMTEAGRIEE